MSDEIVYYDPCDVLMASSFLAFPTVVTVAVATLGYTCTMPEALLLAITVILCVSVSRYYFEPS